MSLKDRTLVLHIGLHKTATTYIQNMLFAHRHALLQQGVLVPTTGVQSLGTSSREGAQSGHAQFTRTSTAQQSLLEDLARELPSMARTVMLSSENFTLWHRKTSAAGHLKKFAEFGDIKVILVLRRQDLWIESYYKQIVDAHRDFETRSFSDFLAQVGPQLLDFYERFRPWREAVGPDNFHVISYDDEPSGAAISRKMLEIAGVRQEFLDGIGDLDLPRFDSVRGIDTVGLRILNSYRFEDRAVRVGVARLIYGAAPETDLQILTPDLQSEIQGLARPINERIAAEWFHEPVPGFTFDTPARPRTRSAPSGSEMTRYIDQVISLCESARARVEAAEAATLVEA